MDLLLESISSAIKDMASWLVPHMVFDKRVFLHSLLTKGFILFVCFGSEGYCGAFLISRESAREGGKQRGKGIKEG